MGSRNSRPSIEQPLVFRLSQIVSAAAVLGIAVIMRAPRGQGAPLVLLAGKEDGRCRSQPSTTRNLLRWMIWRRLPARCARRVRAITVPTDSTIVLTPDSAGIGLRTSDFAAGGPDAGRRPMARAAGLHRRALAPIYDTRLDFRRASRLLVIGDLRVPSLAVRYEALTNAARVTIAATPPAASSITQDDGRLTIKFDADALDVALPAVQPQGLVRHRSVDALTLALDSCPRSPDFVPHPRPRATPRGW